MANKKISELTIVTELDGAETLPIVQGTETKKVSIAQIVTKVDSYTKSESDTLLGEKVDKVTGKGLSTNDLTNDLLTLLNTKKVKNVTTDAVNDKLVITYTDDTTSSLNLADIITDVYVSGATLDATTNVLTLTSSNGGADITVNLSDFVNSSEFTNALSGKVDKTTTINDKALAGNISLDKTDIGLSNVDNTADVDKPVSIATQAAINARLPLTGGTMTGAITLAGDAVNPLEPVTKQQMEASGGADTLFFLNRVRTASLPTALTDTQLAYISNMSILAEYGGKKLISVNTAVMVVNDDFTTVYSIKHYTDYGSIQLNSRYTYAISATEFVHYNSGKMVVITVNWTTGAISTVYRIDAYNATYGGMDVKELTYSGGYINASGIIPNSNTNAYAQKCRFSYNGTAIGAIENVWTSSSLSSGMYADSAIHKVGELYIVPLYTSSVKRLVGINFATQTVIIPTNNLNYKPDGYNMSEVLIDGELYLFGTYGSSTFYAAKVINVTSSSFSITSLYSLSLPSYVANPSYWKHPITGVIWIFFSASSFYYYTYRPMLFNGSSLINSSTYVQFGQIDKYTSNEIILNHTRDTDVNTRAKALYRATATAIEAVDIQRAKELYTTDNIIIAIESNYSTTLPTCNVVNVFDKTTLALLFSFNTESPIYFPGIGKVRINGVEYIFIYPSGSTYKYFISSDLTKPIICCLSRVPSYQTAVMNLSNYAYEYQFSMSNTHLVVAYTDPAVISKIEQECYHV